MRLAEIFFLTMIASSVQAAKFPIYDNQKLPRPAGLRQFQDDEFKLDLKRLEQRPDCPLFGGKEALLKLGHYFRDTREGKEYWLKLGSGTASTLNRWDFNRKGFGADRYVYCFPGISTLALVYAYSGHRELGIFIRGHLLQVAALPHEFWLHAELRGYNPKKPLGMLETASLCNATASTLALTGDLFSAEEKKQVETAIRTKGLQPCLNWLDKPAKNNFTAVISSGAYVAAKYFSDREGMKKALHAMTGYLKNFIEDDGSYGEGSGYFSYPISSLFSAVLCMSPEERQQAFASSGLRYSARWEVYPYFYERDKGGQMQPTMVHFGDNSFFNAPNTSANLVIAALYHDGVATWLTDKFSREMTWRDRLLTYSIPGGMPAPQSPEQAKLPLIKAFDSGDCYIRSTWQDNGIVLGLHAGNGSRINFSHQRAELNSIGLGAYGEYLVVSPGSASYRSPLHYTWDWTTRAANTVTIDDQNQLFPGKGHSAWFKGDNSSVWNSGKPEAKIIMCQAGKLTDTLISEAAKAYAPKMKSARRAVIFVRNPGYFVIVDRLEAASTAHKYTWRLHFNNRDGQGKLTQIDDVSWNFSRPCAALRLYLTAGEKLATATAPGYMHGIGRDYSPGGENEGKPGSSIELAAWNPVKTGAMTFYAVLFPTRKGTAAPAIGKNGDRLTVGSDVLTFKGSELTVTQGEKAEKVKLW